MRPFTFIEPTTLNEVTRLLAAGSGRSRLIAGGSDLLGELKDEVVHYDRLVSLAGLQSLREIRQDAQGLHLGALVTLQELEHDARLQGPYRMLAEAARGVATPEIRFQGTLGGNLCQRPRCLYYRQALTPCLKKGGTECPAVDSPHQAYLSIMGGHGCFCVHASDLAPPLLALQAQISVLRAAGARSLPLADFFVGPQQDVRRENILASDDILTGISIPAGSPEWRGTYLKARERTAGDFPLVSVAVGYRLVDGVVQQPRLVLGGVAPVPWPSLEAAAVLDNQEPSPALAARAARTALEAAQALAHNAFKVDIARTLVTRAILAVSALIQGAPR